MFIELPADVTIVRDHNSPSFLAGRFGELLRGGDKRGVDEVQVCKVTYNGMIPSTPDGARENLTGGDPVVGGGDVTVGTD